MVMAGQVDLVDRPILLAPFCELDEAILFRDIWDGTDDRIT